jgi:hypothetical protein
MSGHCEERFLRRGKLGFDFVFYEKAANWISFLFESQAADAFIKCNVLNKMTALGMPKSYAVS